MGLYQELISLWMEQMNKEGRTLEEELSAIKVAIANEHMWELGYDGSDLNPHTENIRALQEYKKVIEELL